MAETRGPVYEVGARYVEQLNHSNPLHQEVQPVWFRDERYLVLETPYAVVWTDPPVVLPKEYVLRHGTPDCPGHEVHWQLPIFSLIPGSYHYQPVAEIVDVFVPCDYQANALRSHDAVLKTDYPIVETHRYFVHAVL